MQKSVLNGRNDCATSLLYISKLTLHTHRMSCHSVTVCEIFKGSTDNNNKKQPTTNGSLTQVACQPIPNAKKHHTMANFIKFVNKFKISGSSNGVVV